MKLIKLLGVWVGLFSLTSCIEVRVTTAIKNNAPVMIETYTYVTGSSTDGEVDTSKKPFGSDGYSQNVDNNTTMHIIPSDYHSFMDDFPSNPSLPIVTNKRLIYSFEKTFEEHSNILNNYSSSFMKLMTLGADWKYIFISEDESRIESIRYLNNMGVWVTHSNEGNTSNRVVFSLPIDELITGNIKKLEIIFK